MIGAADDVNLRLVFRRRAADGSQASPSNTLWSCLGRCGMFARNRPLPQDVGPCLEIPDDRCERHRLFQAIDDAFT
jgi:hypothetical protein